MPKETGIKALQKKKAQVAHSAQCVSYSFINLASSEEYFDSNDDSDESSDNNFMELEDLDEIIRHLAFFSNNQQLVADNDESSRDFQNQNNQGGEVLGEESVLSRAEEARYMTVLYFLRLLLQGQKKLEAAKMVANIVNGGPWLARSIRPDLREKFSSKSLLHDELVSLKVASYLRFQKFKVDLIMIKSYFEQQILPQLNIESVQHIS
ncbi:25850_t:CDS:2, partial [Gigaspora margarita]